MARSVVGRTALILVALLLARCAPSFLAPARRSGHVGAISASWAGDLRKERLSASEEAAADARGGSRLARHAETTAGTKTGRPILEAAATLTLISAACAATSCLYPTAVEALGFRSKIRELVFAFFSACSILWFLAPSHLATRVSAPLRPRGLSCAARGQKRLAAVLLAAGDLTKYAVTAAQGYFAARLAVEALPVQAKRLLPFIPFNASVMTSDRALKLMGPWFGPLGSLGGWMMELMSVLVRHHAFQLLLVLSALPVSRFAFLALEGSPRVAEQRRSLADRFRELLQWVLSSGSLVFGIIGAWNLGSRSLQWPPLVFAVLVGCQTFQNVLARAFMAIHRIQLRGKQVKGFVGGQLVNGTLQDFQGLEVEILTEDGTLLLPAMTALRFVKRGRGTMRSGLVTVPMAGVQAALDAGKKALEPNTKKQKIKKLLVIPLALILAFAIKSRPPVGRFAYAFAASMYLSAFVIPPPLVLVLAVIIFSFGGPCGSLSSKAIALGVIVSSVKQLLQKPPAKPPVSCAGLDLEKETATLLWQGKADAAEVEAKMQEAASDDKAGASLKKHQKKLRVKGAVFSLLSLILLTGVVLWRPFVFSVEEAVGKVAIRLVIFGMCAGLSLRLLQYAIIPQAARFAFPSALGALCAGPGKTAHWLLAVNSRMAAAAAASAFLLPQVGLLQKILYHTQMAQQIEWLDAWVFQISTAYLGCVLSVQVAKFLRRQLPWRPPQLVAPVVALSKAITVGTCGAALARCILLAVGSPGPSSAGPFGATPGATSITVGVLLAVLALPCFLARNWLHRLACVFSSSSSFWIRFPADSTRVVPARLLRFRGPRAVLRPFGAPEEVEVPAAELKGASRGELRPLRVTLSGAKQQLSGPLRASLKQQVGLLQRPPLQPQVHVAEDSVQVSAFLDRSAPLSQVREIKSALLLAAAEAAS